MRCCLLLTRACSASRVRWNAMQDKHKRAALQPCNSSSSSSSRSSAASAGSTVTLVLTPACRLMLGRLAAALLSSSSLQRWRCRPAR
jgi:hypothetical protein